MTIGPENVVAGRMTTIETDDAAIEEFHRAERRRKAKVFGIAGIVSIVLGIGAMIVAFSAGEPGAGLRFEVKTLAVAIGLVIMGGSFLFNAYRIGTGQIADVEDKPRRAPF
jgi:hypothetical protein